jgi:hypothetical protein
LIAKLRETATSLNEFLVDAKNATLEAYNSRVSDFRDRLIDLAASDPSMVTDLAARLATKANDLFGKDGMLNPVEIAATPFLTASGVVSAVAQATELPEILDKLKGLGENELHVGNLAIRKILGEATELALKVERTGEGVIANYLRRVGRIGQDFFKNYGAGVGAEFAVKAVFHASGLFESVRTDFRSIRDGGFFDFKNHSDNGIDILVKEKYGPNAGKSVGFEVKASVNGTAPSLRGDQRLGADFFVSDRLDRMARGRDPFTTGRVFPEMRHVAQSVLDAQKSFDGYVIKVTNFGKPNVHVDMMSRWVRAGSR